MNNPQPTDEVGEALKAWREGRLDSTDLRSYVESNVQDPDMRDKLLLMLDFQQGGPPVTRDE